VGSVLDTILRRSHKLRLHTQQRFKHRARIRERETDTKPHYEREVQKSRRALLVEIPNCRTVKQHHRDRRKEQQRQVQNHQMIKRLVITHQQQRKLQEARDDHQRITDVARETEKHFQLHAKRERRQPDARIKFETNLHHTLGPTSLLCLECIYLNWNFRGRFLVEQVNKLPSHQLRAETQIGVFSKRVVLPAAAHLDRLSPPDSGGAVEVEKAAGAIACGLFDEEVAVEQDRLQAC